MVTNTEVYVVAQATICKGLYSLPFILSKSLWRQWSICNVYTQFLRQDKRGMFEIVNPNHNDWTCLIECNTWPSLSYLYLSVIAETGLLLGR